jgi:CheY-like chemotaxis protein
MSSQTRLRPLQGVRTLVIEDDADLLEGMSECLELEGAEVRCAGEGDAGFEAFARVRPDVVISDLWMPRETGFDFIRRVRSLPPEEGGLTPAIAISAAENMRPALLAGFHVFVPKPFDVSQLIETVADLAKPGSSQAHAPWTLSVVEPGRVLLTFVGRLESGDMAAMAAALLLQLERGPVEIVADLRRLASFAPSVASVAERALWPARRRMRAVRAIGGSSGARIVCAAACKILGTPCTFADSMDDPGRPEP